MHFLSKIPMRAVICGLVMTSLVSCGLPRSGPYYEDLTEGRGEAEDGAGFDLIDVTPTVVALANINETLGFTIELINAKPEKTSILGVGDAVQVTVWERGENGLFSEIGGATALTAIIEENGHIYLPYIGLVRASGRTIDGLRRAIRKLLEEKTLDPQVEVKRETGDSKSITITGTAGIAGIVPIERTNRSLVSLLASAGFTVEDPETVRVVLRRGQLEGHIWLRDLYENPAYDVPVRSGDVIFLNKDTRHFLSLGAVGQSRVPFPTRDISVLDALALVGGLNSAASDPTGVFIFRNEVPDIAARVSRKAQPGQRQKVAYLLDLTSGDALFLADQLKMRDGDVLVVTEAPFARFQKVATAIGSIIGFVGSAASIQTSLSGN
ncbi:MAG: polysaccharide biosynthesis/export family protein [Pikeienuella sp.]